MNSVHFGKRCYTKMTGRSVVIVAAKRTPIGGFMGQFKTMTAPQLGSAATRGAII